HAWQWDLDGACRWIPDRDNLQPCTDEELALVECRVDTWGGWVFVSLDPDGEDLADFLDPVARHVDPLRPDLMQLSWHKTTIAPCNWKTALDAFNEGYHVPGTHPQYLRAHLDRAATPASIAEMESDPAWTPAVALGRHGHFRTQPRSGAAVNPRSVGAEAMRT